MLLQRDTSYWLLLSASMLWLAMLLGAAWTRSLGWPVAEFVYLALDPVCHQMPGRSFFCFGEPLAACHRCVGLYVGFVAGLLVLPHWHGLRRALLDQPRRLLLFSIPMLADVFLWENIWQTRVLTGFLAAFPFSLFVWAAFAQLAQQRQTVEDTP